jgi:hypothetical protein
MMFWCPHTHSLARFFNKFIKANAPSALFDVHMQVLKRLWEDMREKMDLDEEVDDTVSVKVGVSRYCY